MSARREWVEQNLIQVPLLRQQPAGRATLAERMEHWQTPGVSVAAVDGGEIVWEKGYGLADLSGVPVTASTMFQACSVSKAVTAVGVMRLVQARVLDLDTDVNEYLTTWKVPANGDWQPRITLRQLLSHTAGTTVHGFQGYRFDEPVPTLVQVLKGEAPAHSGPVIINAPPGTRYRYSGGGTAVVQQVLIDATGRDFPEVMREWVFEPLAMAHSTYAQPLPPELHGFAATGHRNDGEPMTGRWHAYPEAAAAGLWTTAGDLARLAVAIQQARTGQSELFLSKQLADEMLTRQNGGPVGIGFFIEGEGELVRFGHIGDNEGYKAAMLAFADAGKGAVVLTNSDMGWQVYAELLPTIAEAYEWPYHPSYGWPVDLPPAASQTVVQPVDFSGLSGEYELRPDYRLSLIQQGEELFLHLPSQRPMKLVGTSDDRLEAPALGCEFRVERDERGMAAKLLMVQDGATLTCTRVLS